MEGEEDLEEYLDQGDQEGIADVYQVSYGKGYTVELQWFKHCSFELVLESLGKIP